MSSGYILYIRAERRRQSIHSYTHKSYTYIYTTHILYADFGCDRALILLSIVKRRALNILYEFRIFHLFVVFRYTHHIHLYTQPTYTCLVCKTSAMQLLHQKKTNHQRTHFISVLSSETHKNKCIPTMYLDAINNGLLLYSAFSLSESNPIYIVC